MKAALSSMLAAIVVLSAVQGQPGPGGHSGLRPLTEAELCAYLVIMPCLMPETMDYARLMEDPSEILEKIKNEPLDVPCNKLGNAFQCAVENVPKYCNLKHLPLEQVAEYIYSGLKHVCDTKYDVYNDAKNCVLKEDNIMVLLQKFSTCKHLDASNVPDSPGNLCKTAVSANPECMLKKLEEVCGTEIRSELGEATAILLTEVFDCTESHESHESHEQENKRGIASNLLRRALQQRDAEELELPSELVETLQEIANNPFDVEEILDVGKMAVKRFLSLYR